MYEPWDALQAPRFTGPRTYGRLPYVKDLAGAEAAVFGMPWDGSTSFRSGARFGPEAIRSASGMLRTYNAAQRVQVFGALSCIDYGDAPTAPGYVEQTLERIEQFVAPIASAATVPVGLGGDHCTTLAELRALAKVHGPLGIVQLDAHTDLWDTYNGLPYAHGTVFRRAIEEGIVDAARVIQAGMRGPLYGEDDEAIPETLGVEVVPWLELAELGPARFAACAATRIGDGPAFFTFDIDFVDPAFSPGTGTPEVGGPSSHEALGYVRALSAIPFVGFDVVEVAPQYDGPGMVTSLMASMVAFEMLSMIAIRKRDSRNPAVPA
jgi:agmatinase